MFDDSDDAFMHRSTHAHARICLFGVLLISLPIWGIGHISKTAVLTEKYVAFLYLSKSSHFLVPEGSFTSDVEHYIAIWHRVVPMHYTTFIVNEP